MRTYKQELEKEIEYASELLKKPPIEPTHFYFACPKCGYANLIPCGTDTRPDQPEPGEQINNKTTAQWIRKNGRLICPFCNAETSYFTNWCSVCGKELM